jgi:amidase
MSPLVAPDPDELPALAAAWGLKPDPDEMRELAAVAGAVLGILEGVQEREDAPPRLDAVREPGDRPAANEDPLNAIVRVCTVRARHAEGPLTGTRVAMKDSMAIAGIPLTAGSQLLGDYVPDADCVVAERLLKAGAEIVAVTNMDDLAFSGGGDSSAYGPTLNPFDRTRTAAGSSSGSAAALYYPNIDVGMGTDQGGSIRAPAAWCGCVGLKPTHSLVPYTGIMGIDATFDHAGPITREVSALAITMDAIAGADPSDPRQQRPIPVQAYGQAARESPDGLAGLCIGIVEEGFSETVGIDPRVTGAVRAAVEQLEALGATAMPLSVPEHLTFGDVAFAGFIEGMTALMTGGGNGYHWPGRYSPDLALALREGFATRAHLLSPQVKSTLMLGLHLRQAYQGSLYARAQNARPALRAGYDRALEQVDLLLMPTTPGLAHEVDSGLPVHERVLRGWALLANTSPTDMSGHPAITLPFAEAEGLPVGVMLIARHFDDARLISIAATCERALGWRPVAPRRVEDDL